MLSIARGGMLLLFCYYCHDDHVLKKKKHINISYPKQRLEN